MPGEGSQRYFASPKSIITDGGVYVASCAPGKLYFSAYSLTDGTRTASKTLQTSGLLANVYPAIGASPDGQYVIVLATSATGTDLVVWYSSDSGATWATAAPGGAYDWGGLNSVVHLGGSRFGVAGGYAFSSAPPYYAEITVSPYSFSAKQTFTGLGGTSLFGTAVGFSGSTGYLAIGANTQEFVALYKSTDDGASWALLDTLYPPDSYLGYAGYMNVLDASTFMVGDRNTLISSNDGGATIGVHSVGNAGYAAPWGERMAIVGQDAESRVKVTLYGTGGAVAGTFGALGPTVDWLGYPSPQRGGLVAIQPLNIGTTDAGGLALMEVDGPPLLPLSTSADPGEPDPLPEFDFDVLLSDVSEWHRRRYAVLNPFTPTRL